MLHYIGLWPKGEGYKYDFYYLYSCLLFVFCYISHIVVQAISIYFIKDDLIAITSVAYILLPNIVTCFKIFYLIRNVKVLQKLLKVLKADIFLPRNKRQILAINKTLKLWKFIFGSFLLMCVLANIVWGLQPFYLNSGTKKLPFMA